MNRLHIYLLLIISAVLLGCSGGEEDGSIHLLEERGASSLPKVTGTSPYSSHINVTWKGMEGMDIKESGICYNMTGGPTLCDNVVKSESSLSSNYVLGDLSSSSTYYVRPYCKSGGRTLYGTEVSFTTSEKISIDARIEPDYFTTRVRILLGGCSGVPSKGRVCYSKEASMTTKNSMKTEWMAGTDEIDVDMDLLPGTRYYMIVEGEVDGRTYESVKMIAETPSTIIINGHEAVDLGLPSRNLWATCDIGASSPEEAGDYYMWGHTSPIDFPVSSYVGLIEYYWTYYKYAYWDEKLYLTKYNTDSIYGKIDNKTELDLEDDVAHMDWGKGWRIPSRDDLQELIDKCTCERINLNGVRGMKFTGPNGNSMFLPLVSNEPIPENNHYIAYWSRSLGLKSDLLDLNYSEDYARTASKKGIIIFAYFEKTPWLRILLTSRQATHNRIRPIYIRTQ